MLKSTYCLQGNEKVQRRIGESNGVDVLLQCVSSYKGKDPQTSEEEEFMQNCFDILCSCLMLHENKVAFVKVRHYRNQGGEIRCVWQGGDAAA